MVDNSHPNAGVLNTLISICSAMLSGVLTFSNVQSVISIIAGCVAIVSGIAAARYYILKGNEITNRKNP